MVERDIPESPLFVATAKDPLIDSEHRPYALLKRQARVIEDVPRPQPGAQDRSLQLAETRLASDVNVLRSENEDRLQVLEALSRAAQEPRTPGARLTAADLEGKGYRSPLLKLLQLRAVQNGAQSWLSNRAINYDPQHNGLSVEVHHVFPKAWLKSHALQGHPEQATVANFAFLSKWDNIRIGAEDPASYLAKADPQVLRAQWIPTDESLWAIERFDEFCAAR
jgi:hypothetical protein